MTGLSNDLPRWGIIDTHEVEVETSQAREIVLIDAFDMRFDAAVEVTVGVS